MGHYSEQDIKEAARALTGWTVAGGEFRFNAELHDDGEKSILAQTGNFNGDDLVRILLEHPATPRRLAWRICNLFMGEGAVSEPLLNELADGLRERSLEIAWAVETVLRSETFFADTNIGNRVLGPAEFVIGAVRALELLEPPPSTVTLAEWTARLGQDLFYPPNVFGWAGGRAWLTSRSLIGRAKFANALVAGLVQSQHRPFDAVSLANRYGIGSDKNRLFEFYSQLLLGADGNIAADVRHAIEQQVPASPDREILNRIVPGLLASPRGQLG